MKAQSAFSSIAFVLLCSGSVFAQSMFPPTELVSIQPIIHVRQLLPTEVVGFSVQYEHVLSERNSILGRAMWFRDPFMKQLIFGAEGAAVSGELRYYFAGGTTGWHLGPFAEWIMFKYLGTHLLVHGSDMNHMFDVGAIVGHKWITGRISFDMSLRTSWYSPSDHPSGGFFPEDSEFNSHLIVSLGYGFN
jgi:hypothetical protein